LRLRGAVFASGRGSNFEVLADHAAGVGGGGDEAPWEAVLLVSDRVDAPALDRARERGIAASVIETRDRSADEVAKETLSRLRMSEVDFVLLAGYLRLVPAPVVDAFRGRILNIHPALLPAFGGKGMHGFHVHRAVLGAGVRITGATVHVVDEEYDRGRILAQWPVPVLAGDTPEILARRVTRIEHRLYPAVADALAGALARGEEPGAIPSAEPGSNPWFRLEGVAPTFNPFDPRSP
jgi:phosphoribosylglycinamide formyltransferase 1